MSKTGFQSFAAGMIVATSILGGTYLLSDNRSVSADEEKKEITESEVESFLTSNGKISITTEDYEQLIATKDKAVQQQEAQKEKEAGLPQEDATEKKAEIIKYKLTVKSGMTTSEISDLLEQNEIIDDSFKFDQFLIKGNYHQKVQLGSFTVQKGMTYNQLAEILTK